MRRAIAIVLTVCCGILFGCWLLPIPYLITGRASFGGGGLPIEYISFSVIGLVSGFGLYTGLRVLFSRSATRPHAGKSGNQRAPDRLARAVGMILVIFGALAVYTLAEVRAQTTSFNGSGFIAYPAVICLALGGACLFAFRKRPQ